MRLFTQELVKLAGQSATLALALTALGVGAVLTLFGGVTFLAEPERAGDVAQITGLYTDTVYLAWIFPPILGIVSMTGEFRFGTAVQTFLQTPKRGVVLATKMLAMAVGGLVIATASLAGAYLTAWIVGLLAGDPASPEAGRFFGATVALLAAGAVLGPLGVAVGALIRSQLPALAIFLGWVLLLEQILAGLLGPAGSYLPGSLIPRAMSLDLSPAGLDIALAGALTPLTAIVYLALQAVMLAIVANVTTLRRDID